MLHEEVTGSLVHSKIRHHISTVWRVPLAWSDRGDVHGGV